MTLEEGQFRRNVLILGWATALSVCIWLGQEVWRGGTPWFDDRVRMLVHAHASPGMTDLMRGFSGIGEPRVLVTLGVLAILWLARIRRRRTAMLFGVAVAGAEILDQLAKMVCHRPRPAPFFGLAAPFGYSYPSGHALVSCTFFGTLAAIAARRTNSRARRWLYYSVAAGTTAAIGYSRIYLGVHYPSDVLGGYAAAVVWVLSLAWWRRLPPFQRKVVRRQADG